MRRRIFWLVLLTTATVVVAFVVPLCLMVRTLAEDRAMAAADQDLGSLAALVAGQVDLATLREVVDAVNEEHEEGETRIGIRTPQGLVIGADMDPDDPEVARAMAGQPTTVIDDRGGRLLLPVLTDEGTTVIRAEIPKHELREGVANRWLAIAGLGVALIAVAAVIAARLGRRVSEPLLEVAAVARRLGEGDLTARAATDGTTETVALAEAMNTLAERTTELLESERGAVADLSHRLRTPVTALRLDAEAVSDPVLGARLSEHIGVLQRSIDAIVREARRPVRHDLRGVGDAAAVVRDRMGFWKALAEDQQRDLVVDVPDSPLVVDLSVEDLVDVVDVLVDNVFAHTDEGVGFAVRVEVVDDVVVLVVADRGSGPRRPRPQAPREGSTGLGLDIASRAATQAGGSLSFSHGERGTTVEVRLPLRRPPEQRDHRDQDGGVLSGLVSGLLSG